MRAWKANKVGLDNIALNDKDPLPELTSDYDILIKVLAVGLNPVDYKATTWSDKPFPFTLGIDACGLVAKKGSKVDSSLFQEDKTLVLVSGSLVNKYGYFAEYTVHDSRYLSVVPEDIYRDKDIVEVATQLAALPCSGFTAYQIICNKLKLPIYPIQHNSNTKVIRNVLVSAGAGGVGGFCLQLLTLWRNNLPAHVREETKIIATCSTKNADFVKRLGATHVIDYNKEDIAQRAMELSDNEGVDIFIDNVGGENLTIGRKSLGFGGELVMVVEKEESIELMPIWTHAQGLLCVFLPYAYNTKQHSKMVELRLIGDELLRLYGDGKIDPNVGEVIAFEKVGDALHRLKERHVQGKIVARVV